MPPVSRRQKRHEEQVRTVQNRNIAAGTALLLAVGLAIWLLLAAFNSSRTNIYVSTSWVNYGDGLKQIPFAEESAKRLRVAFVKNFAIVDKDRKKTAPDPHEIDGEGSLPESIGNESEDLLVFYFNGHLKAENGEVLWVTSAQNDSQKLRTKPLEEILENVVPSDENAASKRKRTLILLDAGQSSWTPNFPARELNDFQTALAEQVKNWEASDTYVIVSHSPYEISLTSTPLKSSLFAEAIKESLQELDTNDSVKVGPFYQDVYNRVTSYSRNFNNESLQHPMLLKSGVGLVAQAAAEWKAPLFTLKRETDNREEPVDQDKDAPTYKLDEEFSLADRSIFDTRYEQFAASPWQTIRNLELMLLGGRPEIQDSIEATATSGAESSDRDFDIDLSKLERKKTAVAAYQKDVLDFFADTRFSNAMMLWGDRARERSEGLDLPEKDQLHIDYDDVKLKTSGDFGVVTDWLGQWRLIRDRRNLQECIKQVDEQLTSDEKLELTPLQAELLGVASQRYLPLIPVRDAETENDSNTPAVGDAREFKLKLAKDEEPRGESKETSKKIWKEAAERSIKWPKKLQTNSDLQARMARAIEGSESEGSWDAVPTNIDWPRRKPSIQLANKLETVTVNRFLTSIPIELELKVVDKVNVTINRDALPKNVIVSLGSGSGTRPTEDRLSMPLNAKIGRPGFSINFYFDNTEGLDGEKFPLKLSVADKDNRCQILEKFDVVVSEDDALKLSTIRDRVPEGVQPTTSLVRWEDSLAKNKQKPLAIRTLPNVKLPFAFSLQNNSSNPKSFHVGLFSIRTQRGFNVDEILADRISPKAASEYMNFLRKRADIPGDSVFEGGEVLRPLAYATVQTLPGKTDRLEWKALLPPKGNGDGATPEEATVDDEIKTGLLMVFWDQKADVVVADEATAKPVGKPDWYQFVEFRPANPVNVNAIKVNGAIKLLNGIEDELGQQQSVDELKTNTLPELEEEAAVCALFSESHPSGALKRIGLEDLFAGSEFNVANDRQRVTTLLIDVLGVPGYAAFQAGGLASAGVTISDLRKFATGIRMAKIPQGAQCHPDNWSFNPSSPKFLRNNTEIPQTIFLNLENAEANQKSRLEFSLPLYEGPQAILENSQDYWVKWNGGKKDLRFPIFRRHHLALVEGQLIAWSKISRHHIVKEISDGDALELGRANKVLGSWRFVTSSPAAKPSVEIENIPSKAFRKSALLSVLKKANVELDLSSIQPLVASEKILVKVGDKSVALSKLLQKLNRRPNSTGQYNFSIEELEAQLELKIEEGRYKVSVTGQDFFGSPFEANDRFSIKFRAPPKRPSPEEIKKAALKKPVPVKATLTFNAGEKEIEKIRDFTLISINGISVPFGEKTDVGKDRVYVQRKEKSLVLHGLTQNRYKIKVSSKVKLAEANVEVMTAEKTVTPGRKDLVEEFTFQ